MIIKRLRLRNFRQYLGEHDVMFADGEEHNVTVIEGPNGAGKSGLFMALNWCLYGRAPDDRGTLLSKAAETEGAGFVEVHFRHEGRQFVARRTMELIGGTERYGDLQLDRLDANAKVTTLPNPTQAMNGILPADARRYFFFDGEKIDEMSRPGHEAEVNDAVRSVLKLRILERAVEHLAKAEKDLAKKARQQDKVSQRETVLIERSESLTEHVRGLREQKHRRAEELKEVEAELASLRKKLSELEEVKTLAKRETELDEAIGRLEIHRAANLDQISLHIQECGPAVAGSALEKASAVLDEKRARGEIPSSVRQSLIDDLLQANLCICERPLDEASRDALVRRREVAVSNQLEETVQLVTGRIKALLADRAEPVGRLRSALEARSTLIDEEASLQRQRDELRQRLKNDYSETVRDVEERRAQLDDRVRDLVHEMGRCDSEIDAAAKQRDELANELKQIQATDVEARRAVRRYELASQAAEAAAEILEEFRSNARRQIEDATDEIFKSLLWKKQQFERVRISEEYSLDVIDRFGRSALEDLSAGERQVLSLSFIIGMAKVAEDGEVPFVIDTPLGRISEEVRENIARRLPELAPQVVLLVTDQELTGGARDLIEPSVGADYRLLFDDSTGTTEIEEVARG